MCSPYKTCTCCGRAYPRADWEALPLLGLQPTETEEGRPANLVLKNCACGSTIAVEVPTNLTHQ